MGSDLTEEFHLAAPEGPTGTDAATPVAIETKQLPDAVESQTSRLDRVSQKMAMEEPVIEANVSRGSEQDSAIASSSVPAVFSRSRYSAIAESRSSGIDSGHTFAGYTSWSALPGAGT